MLSEFPFLYRFLQYFGILAVQILRGLSFGLSFLILWGWGWFPHLQDSPHGILEVAMPAEVHFENLGSNLTSDLKYLMGNRGGSWEGRHFYLATQARGIPGQISGRISEKVRVTCHVFFRKLRSAEGRC